MQAEPSIRHQLERDTLKRHPRLVLDRARRRQALARAEARMQGRARDQHRPAPERRPLRWQDRVLLCLAVALMLMLLLRMETAQADTPFGLQLQPLAEAVTDAAMPEPQVQLALDTMVHVEVNGLVARVQVAQTFRNDSPQWVEGTYRYPLPDGAAVDRLWIRAGDRLLEGEIREREDAQRVYQAARDSGRAAGLVTQERRHQFSTRLANIGPGEQVHVVIAYLVNVDFSDGRFDLRLPMTFTPAYDLAPQQLAPRPTYTSQVDGDERRLRMQVDLVTAIGMDAIRSHHHDVDIETRPDGYRVTLSDGLARPDRDFELSWAPALDDDARAALQTWDDGEYVYAQLMLVPPRDDALVPQSREVIFIIDTSGSMMGASIDQARTALARGIDGLAAGDRFNVIEFNSETTALWDTSVPVSDGFRAQALDFVGRLDADGGTMMAPALQRALRQPEFAGLLRQVVFITDGAVGNEQDLLALVADELADARLFTVAIGSAPNSGFMRKAAEIGRGHSTHIGNLDEVEARMTTLWNRIRLPAVSDIRLDWGAEVEYYPEIIPDLYAGEPLWVVARMPRAPGAVSIVGELNGMEWRHDAMPAITDGGETLATIWARHKVEALQDATVFGADPQWTRAAITDIALEHGLLTQWTSLVAIDKTPARPTGAELARGQVRNLLPAGSAATTAGFPATATGWKTQMLLALLVLAVSGGLFARPFFRFPKFRSPAKSLRALSLAWKAR
ncbi:VWA domain-containing protein [Marinihelvus fidelis]|uniref:VWA domain-containing protein n=1 Tax=Marinihelvus fidelis TaxID=2613842 RepID=A0A5N0TAH1_9GAMM|nr:VIT domain-containing protein [Marinihelvus fidelis]KAA9130826.1 VWA domain-containing protein [Marinihelvus fidelis]